MHYNRVSLDPNEMFGDGDLGTALEFGMMLGHWSRLEHQRLKIWAAKEIWSWGRKFGRGLGLTEPTKMEIQK